jgi:hypothetical protein
MVYMLEIYEPGSTESAWVSFESDSPFGSISVGDIINPGVWEGSNSPMTVLKAVAVEHLVWEAQGEVKHKIMVFTTEMDGARELRTG